LESKSRNIFRNTKIAEIQHRELRQPGAGKTEKNKLKWWKFTNNGYPAHHLCAQILANPHQGDTKIKHFFEDGEIIYNLVFPVHGKHLRFAQNIHQKKVR
jgi:hypothetical protein